MMQEPKLSVPTSCQPEHECFWLANSTGVPHQMLAPAGVTSQWTLFVGQLFIGVSFGKKEPAFVKAGTPVKGGM